MFPPACEAADAADITKKDHDQRRIGNPGHGRHQISQFANTLLITQYHDGILLQVRLCWSGLGTGQQDFQQIIINPVRLEGTTDTASEDTGNSSFCRPVCTGFCFQSESLGDLIGYGAGHAVILS